MLGKDLLGLYDTSAEDITAIIDTAVGMKKLLTQNLKKLPHLQGRTVTTLFYENSTRTRCSFELAAKYLGAGTVNISASSSSVQKGETLIDTGRTLDAMKNDVIVIRHPMGGAPHLLAKNVKASVVNGGDGMNEPIGKFGRLNDMTSLKNEALAIAMKEFATEKQLAEDIFVAY